MALFVLDVLQAKKMTKRNLFAELTEGFDALADARQGKRALRMNGRERSQALCAGLELRSEGEASQSLRFGKLHYLKKKIKNTKLVLNIKEIRNLQIRVILICKNWHATVLDFSREKMLEQCCEN